MSLFGHHHAQPTLSDRLADAGSAIAHLPLAFWLTVLPIAGGLAIAYVTHRLNVSRDRQAVERDERRRLADDERVINRVHTDLTLRLTRHRDALRNAARDGNLASLAATHAALARRAAEPDVIDVLAKRYLPFMAILEREERTLATLARGANELTPDVGHADEFARLETAYDPYLDLFAPRERSAPDRISR